MAVQMNLQNLRFVLEQEGESITTLFDIVDRFKRGTIVKPPHQRDKVWDDEKKRSWVKRLQERLKPVGIILTYQIDNKKPSPVYLNDGFQRISTTLEYLDNSTLYGDTKEDAEMFIRACRMPTQHRHYTDHDQALTDFQQINLGTYLTSYEFCKGILSNMNDYHLWEPLLQKVIDIVHEQGQRIQTKRYKMNREEEHKLSRNAYALFHRFITKNKRTESYSDISNKKTKLSDINNRKVIEWKLREQLERSTPHEIQPEVDKFVRLVERETALCEQIWYQKLQKQQGTGISVTLYRFILDCAIWKRNNGVATQQWEEFLTLLLKTSNGSSQIARIDSDGVGRYSYTLSLSKLNHLKGICEIIGSPFYQENTTKPQRKRQALKPGYDNSHILPFSLFGDGETIPEPASLNRARGAAPIDEEK